MRHTRARPPAAAAASPAAHQKQRPALPAPSERPAKGERWLYGRHAVAAALANPERRWHRLAALAGGEAEARALAQGALARQLGAAALAVLDRNGLAAILPQGAVHQGLALMVEPLPARDLDEVLREALGTAGRCVVVVLDEVSDPHNVGAVLRSAAAFGACAVVVGHGAPPVTGALAKAASGALETVPLVRAGNTARALDRLKAAGFWVCGLDETASAALGQLDLGERVGLVLGSEGAGMRRLVRARCDFLARLPTSMAQPTLNVSNAAAVALYELVRDRKHD